ncbi:MAG: polysaccharide deacetylase family protein [Bacteroidetes bacterium]|nr:polysaccharide deacetylase family protein [Bacteroidota bacterium]MDA1122117.1 polysaccharide deacetylase family protein [Bacteroidota bacterium]
MKAINRRNFSKTALMGSLALGLGSCFFSKNKTHILTLSFDDGFKKSFYRLAEIHENYGLKACLNVIATGHLPTFKAVGEWILPHLLGNFNDWNTLKNRGHEVMPHSWEHLNLTEMPGNEAKERIEKCLDYFEKNLDGYEPENAVYNFAFNASTPELDNFALERARAVRTGGWMVLKDTNINPIPISEKSLRLGCWSHGPDNADSYVETEVNKFLEEPGGWLILNLHGLDNEGWGPLSTDYLDRLLKRLVDIDHLEVVPTGEVLKRTSN